MIPDSVTKILNNGAGPLSTSELHIGEALKVMELELFCELNDCYFELDNKPQEIDSGLLREIAEIQCALDIVQSAKSVDEQLTVYNILKNIEP